MERDSRQRIGRLKRRRIARDPGTGFVDREQKERGFHTVRGSARNLFRGAGILCPRRSPQSTAKSARKETRTCALRLAMWLEENNLRRNLRNRQVHLRKNAARHFPHSS